MITKLNNKTIWCETPHTERAVALLNQYTTFNVVDVETTGLKKEDRIVQCSLIHYIKQYNGYSPQYYFDSFIQQPRLMSKQASSVNGITDDILKKAPWQADIFPKLKKSFGDFNDTVFVAYNGQFDIKKLDQMWQEETGDHFPTKKGDDIDVMKIAQEIIPRDALAGIDNSEKGSYKQTNVCELLGIDTTGAHNSLKDVELTATLLGRLMELYQKGNRNEGDFENVKVINIKHEKYAHDKDYLYINTSKGVIYKNLYDDKYYDKYNIIIQINMHTVQEAVKKYMEEEK